MSTMKHGKQVATALILSGWCVLTGCRSAQEKALEQAKAQASRQAAATGQAQQVTSVDEHGNTTTVVVPPPSPAPPAQPVITPAASAGSTSPGVSAGPVVRPVQVSIPAGTTLAIRINQHISVKTTRAGDRFDGEVVAPIDDANGRLLVPKGTPVAGVVDAAHRRGHFKGRSVLALRLTSMTLNHREYAVDTRDLTRTKKGKGKRSAAWIGGGTGLGMLVGGVASGGTGLLIGGLSGAGAGTAIAGLTGNRDVAIASESIVHFRLAEDLVVQP